jgi:uncharacterized SAM-binding protein YcdF (DUF218 family)
MRHAPPFDAPAALLVLGARLEPGGAPGPALERRIAHAAALWSRRAPCVVIVTGGPEGAAPTEARVMRDALVRAGVPESLVIEEGRARNTFENAGFSIEILRGLGLDRAHVVTDRCHLPRALLSFRLLGLRVSGSGPAWPGAAGRSARRRAIAHEAIALPLTLLRFLANRFRGLRRR